MCFQWLQGLKLNRKSRMMVLSYTQEDLSLIIRTHLKKPVEWCAIPVLRWQRQADPQGWLSQPFSISKVQTNRRCCFKSQADE